MHTELLGAAYKGRASIAAKSSTLAKSGEQSRRPTMMITMMMMMMMMMMNKYLGEVGGAVEEADHDLGAARHQHLRLVVPLLDAP
jgi:hypothetical protein